MKVHLLKKNRIWEKSFVWITNNSKSNHLFFHNIQNSFRVFELCYLSQFDIDFTEEEIVTLGISALFVNYNHSGTSYNSSTTIEGFQKFINQTQFEINMDLVKILLVSLDKESPKDTLIEKVFNDCVILSAYNEEWVSNIFYGKKEEFRNSMKEIINNETTFLLNYEPLSEWGQIEFKKIKGSILMELDYFKKLMIHNEYR